MRITVAGQWKGFLRGSMSGHLHFLCLGGLEGRNPACFILHGFTPAPGGLIVSENKKTQRSGWRLGLTRIKTVWLLFSRRRLRSDL
jgi:hypothetical protein